MITATPAVAIVRFKYEYVLASARETTKISSDMGAQVGVASGLAPPPLSANWSSTRVLMVRRKRSSISAHSVNKRGSIPSCDPMPSHRTSQVKHRIYTRRLLGFFTVGQFAAQYL